MYEIFPSIKLYATIMSLPKFTINRIKDYRFFIYINNVQRALDLSRLSNIERSIYYAAVLDICAGILTKAKYRDDLKLKKIQIAIGTCNAIR